MQHAVTVSLKPAWDWPHGSGGPARREISETITTGAPLCGRKGHIARSGQLQSDRVRASSLPKVIMHAQIG